MTDFYKVVVLKYFLLCLYFAHEHTHTYESMYVHTYKHTCACAGLMSMSVRVYVFPERDVLNEALVLVSYCILHMQAGL